MNPSTRIRSSRELHEAQDDLERLLALRQNPAIALLLRQRFVEACLELDPSAWAAYGFPAALNLVRALLGPTVEQLPAAHLAALSRLLEVMGDRPIPPLPGASSLAPELAAARDRVRVESERHVPRAAPTTAAHGDGRCHAVIPVVAELIDPQASHPLFAGLHVGLLVDLTVSVEFVGHADEAEILVIDGDIASDTRAGFAEAVAVIERLRTRGAPAVHRCRFRARCLPVGSRLRGRSASLGFLLAAAAARSHHGLGASYLVVEGGTAMTGDLAGTRAVPVDAGTLPDKIAACLDGSVRRIVVPREQAAVAQEALENAAEKRSFPFDLPEIIAVGDTREFWKTGTGPLRRVRRSPQGCISQWSERLTRSRLRMGLVGAACTLLAAVLAVWLTLRAAPPVSAAWSGETTVIVRNEHGLVTHRIELPYRPDFHSSVPAELILPLGDLNADHRPDLLAIHGSAPLGRDLLTAVRLDHHAWSRQRSYQVLWTRRSDRPSPDPSDSVGDLLWWCLSLTPRLGRPSELLALSRSRQGSLSVVARLEPATGEPQGICRNHGHLERFGRIAFESPTDTLVVYSGTENRLARGLVAFFDPDRMTIPNPFRTIDDAPGLVEPSTLGRGLVAAWSFTPDRFGASSRAECEHTYREADGTIRVEVGAYDKYGVVIYELDPANLTTPVVTGVYFTDATLDRMRKDPEVGSPGAIAEETDRLAREVQTLTSHGWRPAGLGARFLPTAPSAGPRDLVREGRGATKVGR